MHEHVRVGLATHGFRAAPLFSATTFGGSRSTRLTASAILLLVIFCDIDTRGVRAWKQSILVYYVVC